MRALLILALCCASCGCSFRVVTKARDDAVAKQFANIHEAAAATERGVDPALTCPSIRKACKAGLKTMGYHLEVGDE